MTVRAVIWAGVSSRHQVEDKDSLPRQIAEGEALCERQGWHIVARLQVPGATRSYVDLADAIDGLDDDLRRLKLTESNAYRDLSELIAKRQVDVLVCRSRDRLARTDSLIAGIEERLRRIDATVYSMAMPPTGKRAGDFYVSAVERASAQHEVDRFRERARKGMDDRLRRGMVLEGPIPFPYIEERTMKNNKVVRWAIPDPEKVSSYLWAVDAVLNRTLTSAEIGQRLNSKFPEQGFSPSKLSDMLKNAMPVGLVIRKRATQEDERSNLIVYDQLDSPYWLEIEALLLHRVEVDKAMAVRKLKTPRTWLVTVGQHEPIIAPAIWLELQRFLDVRSTGRRPPSRNRLWSGLLWCGRCGARMYASGTTVKEAGLYYGVYICSERFKDRTTCDNVIVPERDVTAQMVVYLEALRASVSPTSVSAPEIIYDPLRELERQRHVLSERRTRLLLLFETGRIDLDTYDSRITEIETEQLRVQEEINRQEDKRVRESRAIRNMEEIAKADLGTVLLGDIAVANRWLRNIISRIWIDNKKVTGVEL